MKENELIYCREESVPKTRTRKKFIKDLLTIKPETYTDKEYLLKQCNSHTDRSVSDILSITRSRFPKTSLKAVVRILNEINQLGECDMVWCRQVKKFVVRRRRDANTQELLTRYSKEAYEDQIGIDNISYKQLQNIKKELDAEKRK